MADKAPFSKDAEGQSTPKKLSEEALAILRRARMRAGETGAEVEEDESGVRDRMRSEGICNYLRAALKPATDP